MKYKMNQRIIAKSPILLYQNGRSLIELMVSIAIGLLILSTVLAIYLSTSRTTNFSEQEALLNEDGSLALNILQQQFKLAGFSNFAISGGDADKNIDLDTTPTVFGCSGAFTIAASPFGNLVCNNAANTPHSIAIRYEADVFNTFPTNAVPPQPTSCNYRPLGAVASNFAGAPNYTQADNRYYIANDPTNDNTPTLYCLGQNTLNPPTATPLIPNVEDMRIQYAITSGRGTEFEQQVLRYVDATQVVDWRSVGGVSVCLQIRSQDPQRTENNVTDSFVDCDGNRQNGNDGRLRRTYKTTIMFRNLLPMTGVREY